jgi:hypothetical protein
VADNLGLTLDDQVETGGGATLDKTEGTRVQPAFDNCLEDHGQGTLGELGEIWDCSKQSASPLIGAQLIFLALWHGSDRPDWRGNRAPDNRPGFQVE